MSKSIIGVAAAMAMLGGMEIDRPPIHNIQLKETKAHKKLREERAKKRKQKKKSRKVKS